MYAIKNGELLNTTKQEISLNRRAILDSELLEKDFITFAATDEKTCDYSILPMLIAAIAENFMAKLKIIMPKELP